MKRFYKYGVGALSVAAAGLTVWSAAANKLTVFGSVVHAATAGTEVSPGGVEVAARGETAPALAAAMSAPELAGAGVGNVGSKAAEDPSVPVPGDLKVTVRKTARGPVVSLQRPGHVVALKHGRDRWVGLNRLDWTPKPGQPATLVWETTSSKTLETVRGEVSWAAEEGKAALQNATLPVATASESAVAHACRAHGDGAGGFVVMCKVDGAAAAATVEGDDPRRGVWSQAGGATMVRFDIPMEGDGVDTKVLGYEKGGRGVIVRVEASRAPGESAPTLALLSDNRVQPQAIRRIGCSCML